ncbi:MAG: M20/M25/M40 family metallo-hydrolase [marine benthic group bacterium]|nr:M20/M25/M40 family metallo-hydrolase [Candidatus Benthicola marisminoris]
MTHRSAFSLLAFLLATLTVHGCSSSSPSPEVELAPVVARVQPEASAASITAGDMMGHIEYLASDELQGRDTPSPGLEKAAIYIEQAFSAAGLVPAGDDGSFIQRWTFEETTLIPSETSVEVRVGDATEILEYSTDFFVLPSGDESVTANLAFAGPIDRFLGESPPPMGGGIAVVTTPPSMGMEILMAARNAAAAGAAGLVLILHPEVPADVIGMVAGQIAGAGMPAQAVPTIGVTWATAERLVSGAGYELETLATDAEETGSPIPMEGVAATVRTPRDRQISNPPNVVGLIRGSDPTLSDTYVVLTAHFDHVGIGEANAEGDSIYNGADDDASGTAVLLEVAEAFQSMPRPPARSVVFLAVSGEEKGLLGAAHFAEEPTVPLEGIIANINMDMIGRNAPDTLIAIGQEFTSLGSLAKDIASRHPEIGLTIAPDPDPSEQAFFRSDHLVFVKKDIPAIFFTTWDHEDYHQPSDEAHAIDADKAARVARLAFYMTWQVADDPEPPTWKDGALEEVHAILEDSPF